MEIKTLIDDLADNGCRMEDAARARTLYESGDMDALVRHLRKCRCDLVEVMHDSQRKVDRMDCLIRRTLKEAGRRS